MHGARPVLVAIAGALLLAACGSSGSGSPTWQPSPPLPSTIGPGEQASPIIPVPSLSGRSGAGSQLPGAPGTTPSAGPSGHVDPNVVATDLTAPVGLTMLPDGTALVGERTTGRIVRVQPRAGQPVPTVRTLGGLDTSGGGGLLDLALSPTYAEDGLVYAYVTTAHDNRVVDFTLTGPVTPVFTGIPKGRSGNAGRIVFGTDGDLYIGTGDAGHRALAADPHSLAGKVLRVNGIGDSPASNPTRSSPVWTVGHHLVTGLCGVPKTPWLLEAEGGAFGRGDEVNLLIRGASYGWPTKSANAQPPIAVPPSGFGGPGGCAVLAGRVWITSLDGQALLSAPLRATRSLLAAGRFSVALRHKYGRLRTVVAAEDGALWLTTSNRDGHGTPVPTDERVIRYLPSVSAGGSPA